MQGIGTYLSKHGGERITVPIWGTSKHTKRGIKRKNLSVYINKKGEKTKPLFSKKVGGRV